MGISFYGICPFLLTGKDQRVKAKTIGPPHGLPKRLTFRSGSDFFKVKRQAPLRESQAFSPSLGQPLPRVLAMARAPNLDGLWRTQFRYLFSDKFSGACDAMIGCLTPLVFSC